MISVISCGIGNINSVVRMLQYCNAAFSICTSPSQISVADKIILPGVGSFDYAMNILRRDGWESILKEKVIVEGVPVLGICLGMQLLCNSSEEGALPGLALIDADVIKFSDKPGLLVPHMGWNYVNLNSAMPKNDFFDVSKNNKFYFVHSYYVKCNNLEDVMTTTEYDVNFVSSFRHKNIIGAQFHPEKSHMFGAKFLQGFIELDKNGTY